MALVSGDPHMYDGGPINIGMGSPYNHINIGTGSPKLYDNRDPGYGVPFVSKLAIFKIPFLGENLLKDGDKFIPQ